MPKITPAKRLGALTLMVLIETCLHSGLAAQAVEVHTISSRPDMVSGEEALVTVSSPDRKEWTAQLNGRDVTSEFKPSESSVDRIALLSGLRVGKNVLTIRVKGRVTSSLTLLNHALTGPIFSGPHQEPFLCETTANGLGSAVNPQCTARTVVRYYYKYRHQSTQSSDTTCCKPGTLGPGFKPYDPLQPPPSDIAQVVTSDGHTVNYIVRREVGTINRAVYDIQFLHQPGSPLPTPWLQADPGWNGRLVYLFGWGCTAGYRQGILKSVSTDQEPLLSRGYAVATSTQNDWDINCNDRLSAETLAMVTEHFIKNYGKPVHTIGMGASGGADQVQLIAQNYPGLLDGIIPMLSFPDLPASWMSPFSDCPLLNRAFNNSKQHWTEPQKTAVSGFATWDVCADESTDDLRWVNPENCGPWVPKELVYDARANPNGVRCDLYTNEINVFGRNPRTGHARRPLDNVGVQYGLLAFNRAMISAEQFVELNELVGGYDEDGAIVSTRTTADPTDVRIAYERGLVLTGGGGLSNVPIIDWRPYVDDLGNGHTLLESYITRERLIAVNGNADNQVILVDPRIDSSMVFTDPDRATSRVGRRQQYLVEQMDDWLNKIQADKAPGEPSAKISRNKPKELSDGCWTIAGERISERASYTGGGKCNQLYPPHGDPRLAAGEPLVDDVLKCVLKPLKASDYSQALSPDQLKRLNAVFPTGVCNYSRPGIGYQVTAVTWQRF